MHVDSCPLCGLKQLTAFLQRAAVPVHQNLLMQSRQQARSIVRGDLEMVACSDCGFVFNAAFDPELLSYGESYDNNQGCSSSFQRHLDDLVSMLINEKDVSGKCIVEVGCGQGQFLQRLVNEGNNRGVGFDPSYTGPAELQNEAIRFESCYYDEGCTDVAADVVICRHVIEHVPDPVSLLKSVRSAIGNQSNAKVYFETPCVDWILRNGVVWDFFYEHCSLFTKNSLSTAFQLAGFRVDEVSHIFGGQYLWLEATAVESEVVFDSGETPVLVKEYAETEQRLSQNWKQRIASLALDGEVALWGAGAKGSTFASLIDPECELIDCLVDLNPNKQGKFVAGTGHEIVAPMSLGGRGVRYAVLMNPNYRLENEMILSNAGLTVKLIE